MSFQPAVVVNSSTGHSYKHCIHTFNDAELSKLTGMLLLQPNEWSEAQL